MKILVTGGAGFIGHHITKLLLNQGHQVCIFDNLSSGFRDLVNPRAKFVEADLRDKKKIQEALQGQEAVIHMAASVEAGESVKKPAQFFENNLICGSNLIEAMREEGVKKLIFSSTAAVYGVPVRVPMDEEHPKEPTNPYGATKLAFESLLSAYHHCYQFEIIILRYFNAYGPGEKHDPETHAIPNFIKAILENRPIPLYWKGKQRRDFVYVEDIAQAHIKPLELSGFHIFNIGTEKGIKIIDLLELIFKVAGKKVKIDDLGERPGDPEIVVASNQKIKKALGWEPKTSLEEGLKKTWEWFKKNS